MDALAILSLLGKQHNEAVAMVRYMRALEVKLKENNIDPPTPEEIEAVAKTEGIG